MTDFAMIGSPEHAGVAVHDADAASFMRRKAFLAAGRHSVRVRLLRRLILAGSVLGIGGLIGFAFFNPFRTAIPSVSIDGAGFNGTQVTMQNPKLTGFKADGRPYTLDAKSAVQDARTPNLLELHDIDAHVTMADQSVVHVVSDLGNYDSSKETMTFDHDVHLTSDSGLDVRMKSAYVEFKTGVVDTKDPVSVVMNSGTVSSDRMHMSDNGKVAHFEGHVHSVMLPAGTGKAMAATLKGTTP